MHLALSLLVVVTYHNWLHRYNYDLISGINLSSQFLYCHFTLYSCQSFIDSVCDSALPDLTYQSLFTRYCFYLFLLVIYLWCQLAVNKIRQSPTFDCCVRIIWIQSPHACLGLFTPIENYLSTTIKHIYCKLVFPV